jgi:hypothetical protein
LNIPKQNAPGPAIEISDFQRTLSRQDKHNNPIISPNNYQTTRYRSSEKHKFFSCEPGYQQNKGKTAAFSTALLPLSFAIEMVLSSLFNSEYLYNCSRNLNPTNEVLSYERCRNSTKFP